MQATEQTAILDAEKEWKILNQLAEIAADIENQTSYYSFQLEEGNQISGTLLVDVHSWISQLQSLVSNTIPQEVVAVALPNPSPTASASDSQNESAEASSNNGKEIDEKVIKEPAGDESGAQRWFRPQATPGRGAGSGRAIEAPPPQHRALSCILPIERWRAPVHRHGLLRERRPGRRHLHRSRAGERESSGRFQQRSFLGRPRAELVRATRARAGLLAPPADPAP